MARITPKEPRAVVCKQCGETFYVERTPASAFRLYCDICSASPERLAIKRWEAARRERDRYRAQREHTLKPGQWALAYDPWQTGQLPPEVLRNALWRCV
jgi:hypothetical protein